MKKYTQEDFDNFERNDLGRIQCPSGDYTLIKEFPSNCDFASDCSFGGWCRFGCNCIFGRSCSFYGWCRFGCNCIFGQWCDFRGQCSFGQSCRFGEWCGFGSDCKCEFGKFYKMLTFGGFGSEGRTTYVFALTDGNIGVRCGCFAGTLEEWEDRVKETYGESNYGKSYLTLAQAVREMLRKE